MSTEIRVTKLNITSDDDTKTVSDRGVYATKEIEKGELIFSWESPTVGYYNVLDVDLGIKNIEPRPRNGSTDYDGWCATCDMSKQVVRNKALHDRIVKLKPPMFKPAKMCTAMDSEELKDIHYKISNNLISLSDIMVDFDHSCAVALYYLASMINHRCILSNSCPVFSRGNINFVATKRILIGEEITYNYLQLDPYLLENKANRQNLLRNSVLMNCSCPDCLQDIVVEDISVDVKKLCILFHDVSYNAINNQKVDLLSCMEIVNKFDLLLSTTNVICTKIAHYIRVIVCLCELYLDLKRIVTDKINKYGRKNSEKYMETEMRALEKCAFNSKRFFTDLEILVQQYTRAEDVDWFFEGQCSAMPKFSYVYNRYQEAKDINFG